MNEQTNPQASPKRVPLTGLNNTRDLGGYKTRDNRIILPLRLIRSGALYSATAEDLRILTAQYHLETIIDFRTKEEQRQKPDPVLPHVTYIQNPILDEKTVGITFESKEASTDPLSSLLAHASSLGGDPGLYIDKLYEGLALNPHAAKAYSRFFDLLLEAGSGSVLWHCTAGKDRVGIGTALLLTALGVDRATVIRDFAATTDFVRESAEAAAKAAQVQMKDKVIGDCIRILLTVSENYLLHAFQVMEQAYGTVEAYLENHIGLTSEKKELLKKKFLTDSTRK